MFDRDAETMPREALAALQTEPAEADAASAPMRTCRIIGGNSTPPA